MVCFHALVGLYRYFRIWAAVSAFDYFDAQCVEDEEHQEQVEHSQAFGGFETDSGGYCFELLGVFGQFEGFLNRVSVMKACSR